MTISENTKKFIYSLLVFPFPVTGIPILVYILPFYASSFNLGLSLVGLIFFAGRIIDVFTDPIMGALVDRYPSKYGKHKHWIFLSLPVLSISAYFLFFPQDQFISGWDLFFALFALYSGFTLANIAQLSWASFIAPDYDERTKLLTLREIVAIVATLIVISIPAVIEIYEGSFLLKINAIGIFALIGIPFTIFLGLFFLKDKKSSSNYDNPLKSFKRFFKNKTLNRLVFASVLLAFAQSLTGGLFVIFMDSILELSDYASRAIFINFTFAVLGIFLWRNIGLRYTKHFAASLCLLYAGILFLIQLFIVLLIADASESVKAGVLFFILAMYGISFSGASPLIISMVADVSDAEHAESDVNKSGAMFAYYTTITKVGYTLAVAVPYIFLESVIGFDINLGPENSIFTKNILLYLYHLVPVVCFFGASFLLSKHNISRESHSEIKENIS